MTQHHLEKIIGYIFKDPSFLTLALTHRSYSDKNNERLEFLGDSLLNLIVAEMLHQQFPQLMEGDLSRIRAYHVNKTALAEIAKEFNLGEYLLLGSGELKSGGYRRESILADTLEAIIAAIYLDSDFTTCQNCVKRWIQPKITDLTPTHQKDPKTQLQEYLQARRMELPIYTVIKTTGKEHEQEFEISCQVAGLTQQTTGTGNSRRRAEQMAAERLLKELTHE
jgi:ribonuclease-3